MFVWFKGKIIKNKERTKKENISLANGNESNIHSHDEFVNITEELSKFLGNLKEIIESDESELAQVKMQFEEKKNKMEVLNINLGNEENYNKWLSEEADLLEKTKNNIKKRAESVPSRFTNEYCSKITKQIDSSINDIKNFPNTHIKNIENLRLEINEIGYEISDGKIKIKELEKNIASNELEQNEVSSILESRKQFNVEKLQPLIDEYKRINIKIDQIKVGRGSHEDYSNEKQTLFNLKEKIEEEIRIYENSDFRNLQSKFQNKHIRDPKVKNGEKNTDYDSSEMNMYQPNMLSSAEWNKLKSTNEESSHQSVQTKKDNKENYVLKLCKRCGGNGCLLCHNTGYENH